ncbi:MAG TPA: 2-C-methyl-D-erythritol 4-phosphate cytidylyltransferase [Candidatus Binatia bacterium]|nr:2-C-methyl-D-erythritol 4-phosphate cytidylyltransferase [Candidatus Binatia bacterium]
MKWAAVVVAAGRGARFGRPKQFLELAGLPMVGWSIKRFAGMPEIDELVVATEEECVDRMRSLVARLAPDLAARVVRGGPSRQGSVYEGLIAVSPEIEAVLVHDGARPLVGASDVRAGMREVRAGRAALLAAPVVDTIKVVEAQSRIVKMTLDRRTLWAAQTPQFALAAELRAAHERAQRDGIAVTDDATLLEQSGIEVAIVAATGENFKVTLPADVARAEMILQERSRRAEPAEAHGVT